eukprot:m.90906 g.90906  ORF g.90906 m.90906 type:complete len:129 (+) comp36668_c0_seq5:435-821(+)
MAAAIGAVDLPCDNPSIWCDLLTLYKQTAECRDALSLCSTLDRILHTAGGVSRLQLKITGLRVFFDTLATSEEQTTFFSSTLPFITQLASRLKDEMDKDVTCIPFCVSNKGQSQTLVEIRTVTACRDG